MSKELSTKELLIITAGQLFAELGYDAVSTRMITEKAGVKLSAIHYHFGTKENLYTESCSFAHEQSKKTTFGDVIKEDPSLLETPEGQARIVVKTVIESIHYHFRPDRPEWESTLLLREILYPTSAMQILAEKIFKPDTESAERFYLTIRPGADRQEAAAWSDLMYSQMLFYKMANKTIEMVRGDNFLDSSFFEKSAKILARAMILELGLPLPEELNKDQ